MMAPGSELFNLCVLGAIRRLERDNELARIFLFALEFLDQELHLGTADRGLRRNGSLSCHT